MINWKVRLRHPMFWVALFALVGFILTDNGLIDVGRWESYVQLVTGLLVASGIIVDLTTPGVEDSQRAKSYDKPGGQ